MKKCIRLLITLSLICHAASIHNHTPKTVTIHIASDCLSIDAEQSIELASQESTYIPQELLPQMCLLVKYDIQGSTIMKMLRTANEDQSEIHLSIENNEPKLSVAQL